MRRDRPVHRIATARVCAALSFEGRRATLETFILQFGVVLSANEARALPSCRGTMSPPFCNAAYAFAPLRRLPVRRTRSARSPRGRTCASGHQRSAGAAGSQNELARRWNSHSANSASQFARPAVMRMQAWRRVLRRRAEKCAHSQHPATKAFTILWSLARGLRSWPSVCYSMPGEEECGCSQRSDQHSACRRSTPRRLCVLYVARTDSWIV